MYMYKQINIHKCVCKFIIPLLSDAMSGKSDKEYVTCTIKYLYIHVFNIASRKIFDFCNYSFCL